MKTLGQFANPNLVVNEKGIWQPVLVLCTTQAQVAREKEIWPIKNVFLAPEDAEDAGIYNDQFHGDQHSLNMGMLDARERLKNFFTINEETGFLVKTELVVKPDHGGDILVLMARVNGLVTNDWDDLEPDLRQGTGYLGTRCLVDSTLSEDRTTSINRLKKVVAVDYYLGQLGEDNRDEGD